MTSFARPEPSHSTRRPLEGGTRSTLRLGALLPVMLLAVLAVGGCSSGGSSTASTGATTSPSTAVAPSGAPTAGNGRGQFGAAFQAYSDCLKKNGVTLPSFAPRNRPSGGPSGQPPARPSGSALPGGGFGGGFSASSAPPAGVSADAWAKAQQACASVRPSFAPGQGRPGGGGVDATALAAYVSCLKDHGVTVKGTGFEALRSLDRSDPTVAKAISTCAPLMPTRGAAPSPSASSTA